ncbi:MAG: hypothetical protein RR313_09760 [Anaerovoracaceae bacterium]
MSESSIMQLLAMLTFICASIDVAAIIYRIVKKRMEKNRKSI